MSQRWVVDVASARFLNGSHAWNPEDPSQTLVEIDGEVDPATQRYDAGAEGLIRLATPAELEADALAARAAAALREAAHDVVRATVAWTLFKGLGRLPTGPELAQGMDQWRAAYRALT